MPTISSPTSTIRRSKSDWRRHLRERRRNIQVSTATQAADQAAAHLQATRIWKQSRHIALYLAHDGELDPNAIATLASASGKSRYLPVIGNSSMHFALWKPESPLVTNRYGISEPVTEPVQTDKLDLLIVPLVGFTGSGCRLGMGGGYYDKLLATDHSLRAHKMGLAFACQREDRLEPLREEWDVDLDSVLTERGIVHFKAMSGNN